MYYHFVLARSTALFRSMPKRQNCDPRSYVSAEDQETDHVPKENGVAEVRVREEIAKDADTGNGKEGYKTEKEAVEENQKSENDDKPSIDLTLPWEVLEEKFTESLNRLDRVQKRFAEMKQKIQETTENNIDSGVHVVPEVEVDDAKTGMANDGSEQHSDVKTTNSENASVEKFQFEIASLDDAQTEAFEEEVPAELNGKKKVKKGGKSRISRILNALRCCCRPKVEK